MTTTLCKNELSNQINEIIVPKLSAYDDEEEEEKSYSAVTPQHQTKKVSKIQIQRSQPVMVSTAPNHMEEHKSYVMTSASSHSHLERGRIKMKTSDFLQHSLEKAFWRLDQHTLDKMIASGHSPHIQQIKITKHNGLLTEKEKKYIDKIAHVNAALSALTPSYDEEDSKQQIASTSVHWKPEYPLHLLQDNKAYKRAHNQRSNSKKQAGLLPLTFSRSLTTNRMNIKSDKGRNKNMRKQIITSTQSTTNLIGQKRTNMCFSGTISPLVSPPHKAQIMNIKHVHQSPESSMYSDTDDLMRNVNRKIEAMMRESGSHSIDTRSTPQEINIAINENAVAMDCIELATDASECDQEQKSNLSKSLLLTGDVDALISI
eukprot:1024087_1